LTRACALFVAQSDPHAFNAAAIARVMRVITDGLARCEVYEQRLRHWRSQCLSDAQQHEEARLDVATRELRLVLTEILTLADELASGATERRLSSADAEPASGRRQSWTLGTAVIA
jgi:hypothetical protein